MHGIFGVFFIFLMVFGGFLIAGGTLDIILISLPVEMMIICGAAFGAFLISNDRAIIIQTFQDSTKIFRGAKWTDQDYQDLLCLLFEIIRMSRQNPIEIDDHIDAPYDSKIFTRYPKILADAEATNLICDTLRSATMNYDNPHQVEELLDNRMQTHLQQALQSSRALQQVAEGLPALGIVAAVLGVIKTMGSIDQPPEILGRMIGSALVGTFLGVFLSYGLVGPFATKLKALMQQEAHFYQLIRQVLITNLHNHSTTICIEVGRQNTPQIYRPSFAVLENALKELKVSLA